MTTLRTISTLLPLALTSGINLYATLLAIGVSIRLGWIQDAPPGLDVFASWPVIAVATVMYLVEFLADKIQIVDDIWDMASTFIRPLGAAFITAAALGQAERWVMITAALLAGGVALASHSGKAGSRIALNVASPAENVSNIFVSLLEDVFVGALAFLALKYPFVAVTVALVILGLIIVLAPRLVRWMRFALAAISARLRRLARKVDRTDQLPASHLALMGYSAPDVVVWAKAQGVKGAAGRSGYVAATDERLVFTYDTLFGPRAWEIGLAQLLATSLHRRALTDVLEIHYQDTRGKPRGIRFAFTKDRSGQAERLAARLLTPPAASG